MKYQKPLILLLSIFSFTIQPVIPQTEAWNRIQPLPQEHDLYCVRQIPGTGTIVAAGAGSTIMYSADDGESWDITLNPAGLPNQTQFLAVNFFDSQYGYAAANYGTIIRTTDGGSNWEVVYRANEDSLETARVDIHLFDAETAVVVGYDRLILRTEDGGENWTTLLSPRGFLPNSVDFIDGHTGFIVGTADTTIILKTINGGLHWEPQAVRVDNMQISRDVHFINQNEGIISGYSGRGTYILKTDDMGDTWQTVYFSAEQNGLGEIDFKDEVHGAVRIYSWTSSFLYSDDGGDTWYPDQDSFFYQYSPCYSFFYSADVMLGVGRLGKIGRKYNNSNTWEDLAHHIYYDKCRNGLFTSESTGYCLHITGGGVPGGRLRKTTDGGNTWFNLPFGEYVGNFDFVNDQIGFAAVQEGGWSDDMRFFKTADGGNSWNELYNFGEIYIYWDQPVTVDFIDSLNGIVSFMWKSFITRDGGTTWENLLFLDQDINEFHGVEFLSPEIIFLSCLSLGKPVVYKSFDGGYSFDSDTIPQNWFFAEKVAFLDHSTGFLLVNKFEHDTGFIYKTTDGGETWYATVVNDTTFASYKNICFPNDSVGYVVGAGSYTNMLKTTDGGETWDPINSSCSSGLSHLYFHNEWHGFVFGNRGVIMETFTGGIVGTPENHLVAAEPFFTVSPNPTANNILIAMDKPEVNNVWVEIINLNGDCVYRNRFSGTSAHNDVSISLQDFPSGIYVCRILNGNKLSSRKIVKL